MMPRRSFDEHVALFGAFAARVGELPPSAWNAIEARCASLDDASFEALLARAALSAKPRELWIPEHGARHGLARTIKAVSDATQHAFALAGEMVAEFDAPMTAVVAGRRRAEQPPPRSRSPIVATLVAAHAQLDAALEPLTSRHPGVITAVRAAGEAVLRHDWLAPEAFAEIYRYVAAEIPFESLELPPNQPPTTPGA